MDEILEIVKIGDDVLREKCTPVKEFDSAFKMLTSAMLDELLEADGVGLAAPQVGIPQRFFVVDIRDGKKYVFANPEIIETSIEEGPYEEGCLSIPGVYHEVIRPLKVKVQARDENGKLFNLSADGLLARVIQHEYDHLEGKLLPSDGFCSFSLRKATDQQPHTAVQKRNYPNRIKAVGIL